MKNRYTLIFASLCCFSFALWFSWGHWISVRDFREVATSFSSSDALIYDRSGSLIHEMRVDLHGRRLDWVNLKEISPALTEIVIQTEDRRFYQHTGIDWFSVSGSLYHGIKGGRVRGASTITMQLAALLSAELNAQGGRTLWQKWRQMSYAKALEQSWAKDEILEAYLNLASFRGELQGIAAGSRGLFKKSPHGLNYSEALVLTSLLSSPNSSREKLGNRVCSLSKRIHLVVDCESLRSLVNSSLKNHRRIVPTVALAHHAARRIVNSVDRTHTGALRIKSTLDSELQVFAAQALHAQLQTLRLENVKDAAVLVADNSSGDVLAYLGSSGKLSSAPLVDGVTAHRQAGSTLKPFLYGLALEKRLLTSASLLLDSPLDVPVHGGMYRPRNYDNKHHGLVSARVALASSLNVPAVKTLGLVGVEEFVELLQRAGFSQLSKPEFYGVSLALGTADVSLWELVNAYRTLANNGNWTPLKLTNSLPQEEASRQALSPETSFIVSEIISDRDARSLTFDWENPLATSFWSAVKTGTSKDMRDNWCVGFSRNYTVGVWVGNFSGASMWNVSGISGAAPLWREIVSWLEKNRIHSSKRSPAEHVVRVNLGNDPHWFIEGTEPGKWNQIEKNLVDSSSFSQILYPPDGAKIARDPDIPQRNQFVPFQASAGEKKVFWQLDGKNLVSTTKTFFWKPVSGKHRLLLLDASNHTLDEVQFEVRS